MSENRSIFKIRHGSGIPTSSNLSARELGFSDTTQNLYIHNGTGITRIGINALTGSVDPVAADGQDGDFYIKTETTGNETKIVAVFSKVGGAWLEVSTGGGDASYLELTQAEYNALTPAEKNNGTIYFITDAASGGDSGITMNVYTGTLMSSATDGVCTLTKLDAGPCYIYNLVGWFKANGTISTATEYTPIFQFDTGVIPVNFGVTLAFGESSGFSFCRITSRSASDTVGVFYGTSADKYYNFNQTYFIQKS